MDNKHNLLITAIKASVEAGKIIMDIYEQGDFQVEYKSDNSPLTLADKKANKHIVDILNNTNIPVLSEEGEDIPYEKRKSWKKLWIVDPLDGTKEFVRRNGDFTVNIALVENGNPVMGVIYVPVYKQLYFAEVGTGAFKIENIKTDGHKFDYFQKLLSEAIKLPTEKTKNFTVVASKSHRNPRTLQYLAELKQKYPETAEISRGSSLKFCLVAEGKADLYPRLGPTKEWDTAAGHAIVAAAGFEVLIMNDNKPLTYNRENLVNPDFIVIKK